ncbi:MAG: hypothetical protein J6J13_03300 [Clostridia bacterium]|nr:hypothetical protein [Clostridia bacterium]
MNWWQLLLLWLGGWLCIIVLNITNRALSDSNFITEQVEKNLVLDGNNLFSTGLFYFIANIACFFLNYQILHWILIILGVAFCIPPIISLFAVFKQASFWKGKYWLTLISAIICDAIPFIMAINIYFVCIK